MGKRNCAFDGCNALEFRAHGYCLRHKDSQPELPPPTLRHESIKEVAGSSKEEWTGMEEDFFTGPFGWAIAICVWLFPPILLLLIPIYFFKRPTSKGGSESSDRNPEANLDRDEGVTDGNYGQSQLPWWIVDEEAQG